VEERLGGLEDMGMTGTSISRPATCRSCGNDELSDVLSLGELPLANAYPRIDDTQEEPRFPLDLAFCPRCTLVQLRHSVPPEQMFSEYLYFSSYSESMLQHVSALVDGLVAERRLGDAHLAVELASNDGYLLQYFRKAGVRVLGIEPAANIARVAMVDRQIPTIAEFFDRQLAATLAQAGHRADVVCALNVLAHVPDLNGFVAGIAELLAPGGVAVIEVPYVRDMVERTEFDTIYHEHLCYFSVHAVAALAERHGLALPRVERVPIHGGSLRLHVGRAERHGPTTEALLAEERALGMDKESYYAGFRRAVEAVRESLTTTLRGFKAAGARIGAYGAAAKGTILLNYCGLGRETIDFVADRNTHKQGRRMPGCGVPIVDTQVISDQQPDYVLLHVWNIKDEVLRQQAGYRQRGGRFIVAIPRVELI
jgi:SAM-dependent methyltransferase